MTCAVILGSLFVSAVAFACSYSAISGDVNFGTGWVLVVVGWGIAYGTQELLGRRSRKRKLESITERMMLLEKVGEWRTKGTKLRNDGCRVKSKTAEDKWYKKRKNWQGKAMKAVERLSPGDAERMRTLGKVTAQNPDNCAPRTAQLEFELRMLTQETELMDEFLLYWGPYVTGASALPPQV